MKECNIFIVKVLYFTSYTNFLLNQQSNKERRIQGNEERPPRIRTFCVVW